MALRKPPRQQRSRDMIERIVVAARDVLVEDGYNAFTTNRVADRAGVSPGSLYQYFGDKHDLIEEVTRRYIDRLSASILSSLVDHVGADERTMAAAVAEALLAALEQDARLLTVVWEDLPVARHRDDRRGLEQRVQDVLRTYLGARLPDLADPARAAWTIVLAVEFVAVRFVIDPDPPLTRAELVDDLVALSLGLLPLAHRESQDSHETARNRLRA